MTGGSDFYPENPTYIGKMTSFIFLPYIRQNAHHRVHVKAKLIPMRYSAGSSAYTIL